MPPQSSLPSRPQHGSPKRIKNDSVSILKRFERKTSKQQEDEMDADVLELIEGLPSNNKDPKDYAVVLCAISTSLGSPPINGVVTNIFKNTKLLEDNLSLFDLLVECVRKRKFADIRDLELLRTYRDLDATEVIKQSHEESFLRLEVAVGVRERMKWTKEDIIRNRGVMHADDAAGDDSAFCIIQDILTTLHKPKTYTEAPMQQEQTRGQAVPLPDIDLVRENYPDVFEELFKPADADSQNIIDGSEFITLFNVLRCFLTDTVKALAFLSSSSIMSNFYKYFIHPTFLYPHVNSQILTYQEDKTWSIPMLVHPKDDPSWYTFSARNAWAVVATRSGLPLIISEVMSQQDPSNEARMLLEAIVICRVGSYLIKSAGLAGIDRLKEEKSKKRRKSESVKQKSFFVVAIYLEENLVVRRYLVKPENEAAKSKVHLFQKKFDLKNPSQACSFLLELFNLSSLLEDLANSLDVNKEGELKMLKDALASWKSLPSTEDDGKKGKRKIESLASVDSKDLKEQSDPRLQSREVQEVLDDLGYTLGYIYAFVFYPNIAMIYDKTTDTPVEYLKVVNEGSKEVEILTYLAKFEEESNHAVRPIRSWAVPGGTMLSLPRAGLWITELEDMSKYLSGVVHQLVEGIAFLHALNVAHLNIKPEHLIIPSSYGRLTIIDFGVAVHVESPTTKYEKRVGSRKYMAPEIGSGDYDPFKADSFSCGIVIQELCERAEPSLEREVILKIADQLRAIDPESRPSMPEVLAFLETAVSKYT